MGSLRDPFIYNTIEVPTVVGLLRNILTQYPDNGQIIKELVQNAEDAGATKVEVMHVPTYCTYPEAQHVVQRFLQEPSLCVYNNAVFLEEDWHGIRKLSDSIKENDPLQVGQFGLGFKSVFHLTDYITIISGKQVLFMDPSEPEDKMCRSLPLKKLIDVLPAAACQQAFGNYLTLQHLSTGNFPATMFWFPLRQRASKISETVYTPEHVECLFKSFAVEADVCLTFLKSLEEITIGEMNERKITVSLCMKITSTDLEGMRSMRQAFKQQLQQCKGSPSNALVCSYQATLQTGVGKVKEQSMRILHYLPGEKDQEWMKWGGQETSKHVPLVGVAVPTSPPSACEAKGHIFSFLPLPPDSSNQTRLPIQVNGAFILNQNRRQVKWRTSESSKEPDVIWNEELAIKVVATAYTHLLKQLLQETQNGIIDAATWYTFLPDLSNTMGRWQQMAEKVWHNILPLPIISSMVRGFLKVQDVLTINDLNTLMPKIAKTVKSVLCYQSLPLATFPDHVHASMSILGQQVFPITPLHLCNTLKMCGTWNKKWNLQHLLCYAANDKNYQNLSGLPLLPLQDQSWTSFRPSGAAVYLCTHKEAKALLGLEGQVTSVQVDHTVLEILQDIAESGLTQVCRFNIKQHGPSLLLQSVTHVQTHHHSQHQVGEWLSQVWNILQNLNLHSVKHIPLLPISQPPQAKGLTSLTSPVVVQHNNCQLSRAEVEVLALLRVVVVSALPAYIKHIELQGYLYSSDRHGITQALDKVVRQRHQSETVNHFNNKKTEEQRKALNNLIDTHSIQPDLRIYLTKLKMFKAQDMYNSVTDVCIEGVNVIAPEIIDFPVSYPQTLLVPSLSQERTLALVLGALQLSKEELCVRVLKNCCGDENISRLVSYILKDAVLVGNSTVLKELRNTRFVPNVTGSLCCPSELYDPDDDDCDALIGETQQPDDSFRQHYPLLRSLGLRKVQEMPWDDLVCLIKHHQNTLLSDANRIKKSIGLLRAINRRHDCKHICQAVTGVPFVCGMSSRPLEYPTNLEWATPPGLLRPQDLKSCKYSAVLGSAVALVKCHDVPFVAEAFGWMKTPHVDTVIIHLRKIITAYQVVEWNRYFNLIKKTYCQLAASLSGWAAQLASLKCERCIFTEQGFRIPAEVYIWPGNGDLQLQPYLHPLPMELRVSEQLFLHLGCARQQNPPLLLRVLEAVREQHQDDSSSREVEQDLQLVVSVLDILQYHRCELQDPLLVPVRARDDTLELAEAGESAYTEAATEWIDSEELNIKVVHQCVSTKLAKALGVAPLQNFLSAGGEAVMKWGQQEPLTTRLHNLLRQYRDGVSVLKELVQNADDAGATTVRLLYDERQNEDSRKLVLGTGMGECQGPALWAYNDAIFSEQDFVNLREIGGGTKELQPTKIGKFGLGFCSVYNLTDVPSFVSGSSYVVFDPHMTHLNHSTNSPGIRFNFTDRRNSYMLRTLQGQFQPFRGVFGCDIQECGSFSGTLFRLPFRTRVQASTSKISNTCYSHGDVVQLLKMFSGVVGQLLLFTQHVSSISMFHLCASATKPTEMVEVFHASRSECRPVSIPGLISTPTGSAQSLLERAAALFSQQQQRFKWNGGLLEDRSIAEVSVRHSKGGGDLCGIDDGEWSTTWITSWHTGCGKSCYLAEAHGGKALPLSAVSVPVNEGSNGWQPQCLADLPPGFYREGHFHCFLPLPVKTFLPVQINGVLEVASDRTNLLTQTEDDRCALSWNATLLGDATVHAHLGLAEALRYLRPHGGGLFYAIWPVVGCGGGTLVEGLTKSFYQTMEEKDLELFQCGRGDWHPLSRCLFLEEDFLQAHQVGSIAFEFLETYLYSSSEMRLIKLPRHFQAGFDRQILSQHTITQDVFFQQYFIPHLSEKIVSSEKRDQLTLYLLDSGHNYVQLLCPLFCIPTQPHGTLKPPSDLISPRTAIARMFSVQDEKFPVENFLDPSTRSIALTRLGMNTDTISKELVVERAETVADLAFACPECARHRIKELLHYISTQQASKQKDLADCLKFVRFLPVMSKPKNWCVAWHGECLVEKESQWCSNHRTATSESHGASLVLDCPSNLCLPAFKPLVGSSHLILEESLKSASFIVKEKLGVIVHAIDLPVESVVEQLCVFSTAPPQSENALMCHAIFEHMEDLITYVRRGKTLKSGNVDKIKTLRDKKVLITKHGFKEPKLFAMHSESDCAPDLFSARTEGLEKYRCLMDFWGIDKNFDFDVVMEVIQKKREAFVDKRLSDDEVSQVSRLLSVLFKVKKSGPLSTQVLYLPDSRGYLHSTQDLCLDDGLELSSGKFLYLHRKISVSQDMCEWLGIKSKTRKRLDESSNRLNFGQKEPLTTRLRNILNDYPCDSGIMKELLQNADDAGATEVIFYKDFRHLPKETLFDPKWAPIQGPALSVFNNKGFTERDIQSIQDLGNSSKREDPATTGQYGIGFNAVYHLTDAPSFLTRGPEVPQGETLCMFDPHCWYDPAASHESPGVQFVNLNLLKKDHPDSFIGYLEHQLSREGTMFRLPLRTTNDSLISKEILKEDDINKMLQEFKRDMPQCLLFLRKIRKISIKTVLQNGKCNEEYSVEASVSEKCNLPALSTKHGDTREARDPCSVNMIRTSYTINIHDSNGGSSQWLVVQQQGVKENNLPDIVREAFNLKTLNLLPHGAVAILLAMKPDSYYVADSSDIYSTSCYLPLPVKSGLPFSINGHFTLNSSRRDLWIGRGDAKGLWNEWLLKGILVPAAVCAVEQFRSLLFPNDEKDYMTEQIYINKVRRFHSVLPLAQSAKSEKWKEFVKWFYEHVRNEELHFFDSFIPETDLPPPSSIYPGLSWIENPARDNRKGCLRWHAFHASGDKYPVYFTITDFKEDKNLRQKKIADVFKRLGMKVSSDGMYIRLVTADPEFKCPLLSPEVGLEFIKSWDKDINDRCIPGVGNKVDVTPFKKPGNVLSVLKFIMLNTGFSGTCVDKLPLLLTNEGVLQCFSAQHPVFLSSFCDLLPAFGKEFTVLSLMPVIEANRDKFKDVVKKFTPADLGERLPHVMDSSNCAPDAKLPITNKHWLNDLWRFVIKFIEEEYCLEEQMDWTQSKTYILRTLGDWAFYPVKEKGEVYLIPIKNAWQVLSVFEDSVFHKLPVPVSFVSSKDLMKGFRYHNDEKPYIPHYLQLAATLKDPVTVLKLLDFHREAVNSFVQDSYQRKRDEVQTHDILEYFGKHCQKSSLSRNTIRSLNIFGDPMGQLCTLLDRKLIVVAESVLKLDQLKGLCAELSFLIISKPESVYLTDLYTYIEPNCMVRELDLYTKIILPNLSFLNEEQRTLYLKHLNTNLPNGQENELNHDQQSVVGALKSCPFIELDGTLNTAHQFYDPTNPVFFVMGVANLPKAWRGWEWQNMLKLAGMVHKVTPDKFVEFASSLSLKDKNVKQKSEVLCQYLSDYHQDFQSEMYKILDIQFLVPEICDKLETLLSHHQTDSGLVAFSKVVNPKFAHIIWSTSSVLPYYATEAARKLQQQDNTVNMDTPPVADVLEHMVRLCSSMQETPEKSPEVVRNVMESIYDHLSESEDNEFKTLKERDIPIIHIPNHKVFVPINHVVESLEEEILPYLYKAPVFYGKFFNMLKKLGMPESVTVNTYAHVLRMIHGSSKHNKLHPQEIQSMKIALRGLVKLPYKLKNLSVPELFLPTKDETLRSSSEMFVADNIELLLAVENAFHEPVFVGFKTLDILFDDSYFVNFLPERLRPKFLSQACKENLQYEGMLEEASGLLLEIQELLQSEIFKTGALRIINHYKLHEGSGLTEEDRKEIMALLARVTVKQVNSIKTTLTLHNNIVGRRDRRFFLEVNGEGAQNTLTLYLSKKIPRRLISHSLYKMYMYLLQKWSIDQMKEFSLVFACYGKPHDIHRSLDEVDIKVYSAHTPTKSLFKCDVGSYLQEEFLPLLDNGFSEFYEREIVCMKKYLCRNERRNSDEEDDIFVIVEVVRLVDKHATNQMLNTYEVNTSNSEPCLVITKASQLFRFVRKENDGAIVEAQNVESKEEVFRKIRKQVKEIWQVEDEQERRHLLRRLQFKWHPDKNPNQVELCTSVMQYMQSLVGRLERGEEIPDDEDPMNTPPSTPSEAYSSFFRPPPRQYQRWNNRRARDRPRPRSDLPEARRWHRQARSDLEVAASLLGESTSWAVFMCYQAAEKVLFAALYVQDMEEASQKERDGPLQRTLGNLAHCLDNPNAVRLSTAIHEKAGGFLGPLYPTFGGCPQDRYSQRDAQQALLWSRELLQVLGQHIN